MRRRMLSPTPALPALLSVLAAVTVAVAGGSPAHAQSGWRLLDFDMESGFRDAYEWPTAGSTLHFVDALRGYYYPENELAPGSPTYYVTTDGGVTWSTTPEFVPVPQRMLSATFGVSSSGWITRSSGAAWQRIRPTLDPGFSFYGVAAEASDAQHVIAMSQPMETDATTGQLRPIGPHRLTLSTNGGNSWTAVDTMVVETIAGSGERKIELYDSTGFGDLPAPANMTDTFSVGWWGLYDMPDSLSATVGAVAFGRVNGALQNHYYIGRLNIRTMTAAWTKLPFVDVVPTTAMRPEGIQFVTPQIGWTIQTSTVANLTSYTFWRTTNGGQSWTSNSIPTWVDFGSLRFVSPTHGIAMNAVTTDGGANWQPWAHPFDGGAFFAADSTHYYVANRFSLFARSTDAGRTWTRNESGALPRAIAAAGGRVVVGRNYRSILASSDFGETWRDADLEGSVPPSMTTVWAMGMPDSLAEPNRFIGVASFITYAADTSLGVIESTDGGLSWTMTSALAGIKAPLGSVLMEFSQAVETSNTGYIATGRRLYASSDGGRTWGLRDSSLFYQSIEAPDGEAVVQMNATGAHWSDNAGAVWTRAAELPSARNRAIGLQAIDRDRIRALLPDRTRANLDWNLGVSTDGGKSWTLEERAGAPRPLDGYALWRDADTVYAIGRGATFQRSTDGGRTFVMLQDSVARFRALAGWVVAGIDGRNMYVAGAGDAIGAWEYIGAPVSVPVEFARSLDARLLVDASSRNAVVELAVDRPGRFAIAIVDAAGRSILADGRDLTNGLHRIGLDLDDLASGAYFVRIVGADAATVLPLVVRH